MKIFLLNELIDLFDIEEINQKDIILNKKLFKNKRDSQNLPKDYPK